jgi:hypothetical protein
MLMVLALSGSLIQPAPQGARRLDTARPTQASYDCPPRDEAVKHPDLVAFRRQLIDAVRRRDADAVLRVSSPDIRTSFGPNDGFQFFERDLRDGRNQIWSELAEVLRLGGGFETPDDFVAPFSDGCGEPGDDVVVIAQSVRVRTTPSVTARDLTSVSFAILKTGAAAPTDGWQQVLLPNGTAGYVSARYLRRPLGYRAHIAKVNGVWRLAAFIAGN